MLYKKYHRKFVRQFKEGTEFTEFDHITYRDVVEREPFSDYGNICMTGNKYYFILVFSYGTTNHKIYIIKIKKKDVIQEIS